MIKLLLPLTAAAAIAGYVWYTKRHKEDEADFEWERTLETGAE
ncbi:MAG TPA: hypothetical protein VI759_05740 [Dehalococcoidia bacterium]|nr:hypothetical protein [Dehalococcoidia bacterium]